ncbi:MAG: hypothetical protein AB7K71_40940 [Polyangiaceae bacterium]
MRLREVRVLLRECVDGLTPDITGVSNDKAEFRNRSVVERALRLVEDVPGLGKAATKLLRDPAFVRGSTVIPQKDVSALSDAVRDIRWKAEHVLEFLEAYLPEDPQEYFAIRLPDSASSQGLSRSFAELHQAFEQPALRVSKRPVAITLIEPGSVFVEIADVVKDVGTAAAVGYGVMHLLGKLITLGTERAKLRQEDSKVEQESHRVRQEVAKAEQEAAKARQEEAKALQEEHKLAQLRAQELELEKQRTALAIQVHETSSQRELRLLAREAESPEDAMPVLRNAVEVISDLVGRGASVTLQLSAPQRLRDVFPPGALPEGNPIKADEPRLLPAHTEEDAETVVE